MTGDWYGVRTRLLDRGVNIGVIYTGELSSNLSGGMRRGGTYLDNVDVKLTLDLERLKGWRGSSLFIYGLGNHGGNPSDYVGDAQGISNIAAFDTWKVYEAWFEQHLLNSTISWLAGLYDVNAEFDLLPSAGLFLNGSFGTGVDFSQSGKNGPSIFPTTSLGVRFEWKPVDTAYIQVAVLDGVPGDPANPRGTRIRFDKGDGVLIVTEAAHLISLEGGGDLRLPKERRPRRRRIGRVAKTAVYDGKVGVGGWFYTARFPDLVDVDATGRPLLRRGNAGLYLLAEQTVYHEGADPNQNLTLFVRLGVANASLNRFGAYTGGGAVYSGLIPGRDEDEIGVGVAAGHNGDDFRTARRRAGQRTERSEVVLEFTYLAPLMPWLALQPDFQYVINPGTNPALKNAFAAGFRWEISF